MVDDYEERLFSHLRRAGYRVTGARKAIVQALLAASRPLTPQELHDAARLLYPKVGLVTVYRTLEALVRLGVVQKVHGSVGCPGYVFTGYGHRHVALCRQCGRAFIFEGEENLSRLIQIVEDTLHFHVEGHLLQFVGVCESCRANTHDGG